MLKIIESNSFDWEEPEIKVVSFDKTGLTKAAAHEEIQSFIDTLPPESGKVYIHILAMGAGEFYGSNRNADFFPESNLKQFYHTFEDGHIFTHHQNKDPSKAIGKIIKAVYNDRMHRVELIAWVDRAKGKDFVAKIDEGQFPAMSMACKTPYDKCSICGNEAKTRQEYCSHLTTELNRMYPDGRKVMALNVAPLRFFEQSFVIRPADVTSSVLQKVASHGPSEVVSSAELAELAGLTEKVASHKKLSELVKEVEGNVVDYDTNLDSILSKVRDPLYDSIPHLSAHDLSDVFSTMAHLGISPSVGFLAELIGHKLCGSDASGIGDLVEGYVGHTGVKDLLISDKAFPEKQGPNPYIVDLLMPSVKQASLLPDMVTERAYGPVAHSNGSTFVPGTGVGYRGNGPYIEETPVERFRRLSGAPDAHEPGGLVHMIKTLMMIGGAALAAKWYITNTIEQKMQEAQSNQNHGVKIILVKSASDYKSTFYLAKSAMVKALKKVA
jgi:hypothetical protein